MLDKTVNVETEKRDRYGRQIGKVLVNGQDVNLVQVERGMAWFYRAISARAVNPTTADGTRRQKTRPKLASGVCGALLNLYRCGISDAFIKGGIYGGTSQNRKSRTLYP